MILECLVAHGVSPAWAVFLTSMLPIVELRGALPLGINIFHLPWYQAFMLAWFGNMLPVPLILLVFDPIRRLLSHIGVFRRFFEWLFARTRKRSAVVEKYEELGLMIFVAIPLPATGAWTGALIAYLLGLSLVKSLVFIALGVTIAGVIVTTLCLLGWIGAAIAGVALIGVVAWGVLRRRS